MLQNEGGAAGPGRERLACRTLPRSRRRARFTFPDDSCTLGAAPLRGVDGGRSSVGQSAGLWFRRSPVRSRSPTPREAEIARPPALDRRPVLPLTRHGDFGTLQVYCASAEAPPAGCKLPVCVSRLQRRERKGTPAGDGFGSPGLSGPMSCLTIEVMRSGRAPNAGGYCVSPVFARLRASVVRTSDGFDNADSEQGIRRDPLFIRAIQAIYHGEFDPGSGRTLAACFIHASRTRTGCLHLEPSGERVSNT